ncbi:MAG: LamG-like jellyroll fold domain-containing protein [Verrucomicrobiales bacterium]
MKSSLLLLAALASLNVTPALAEPSASRWWEAYGGDEAEGPGVLGFWRFDTEATAEKDSSGRGVDGNLRGATWHPEGKFGGCLEGGVGHPVADTHHGFVVPRAPALSPEGAFTLEMWLRPDEREEALPPEVQSVLADSKYVRDNHGGFMWTLMPESKDGTRRFQLEIGLGARSERWFSEAFRLGEGEWRHVAFTYDGRGTTAFFVDGSEIGRMNQPGAGPMAAAVRDLSLGDRSGSLHHGFPGRFDEVRLSEGVREFRPVRLETEAARPTFPRMAEGAAIRASVVNLSSEALASLAITVASPGEGEVRSEVIPSLAPGVAHPLEIPVETSLRPGEYAVEVSVEAPGWGGDERSYATRSTLPFVLVPRPLPHRMPVVMWGLGGTESVLKEIPRLKDLGFTHCLGLRPDYAAAWEDGAEAMPGSPEDIRAARDMLDRALENDLGIVASVAPGRWLRSAKAGEPFLRVDREGEPYAREDVSGLFPRAQQFCFDTGAALSRAYGDHPAFAAALLHSEVRGESQVSFHPLEREAAEEATGREIPDAVAIKNGVDYTKLPDFPEDRVVADDDPVLDYYRWFWTEGDGWSALHTSLHEGLKSGVEREDFWTFHDPAVRVPSIRGSGGAVDVLSHWTYSYPDPIRIGLCTDELFEMARVNGSGQEVMKMTQVIWYRSQTAPENAPEGTETSPWVDQDPDAAYITIAPMHLREAFWWKLARPVTGIMYHGWGSLVESDSPGSYRFTNPNAAGELRRLVREVVEPLGPTLLQVPDAPSDVAFLESFTSQMFARRGTYGWNRGWAGDLYHVLMWAQMQPHVLYEESLLADGLDGVNVLVMGDCDVLTESVVQTVREFQERGGLVVGDAELCPAIDADVLVPRSRRTKEAATDRDALRQLAANLRSDLEGRYEWPLEADTSEVVTRRRRAGSTDYLFAVNDRREAGIYVGGYGMVLENGLPSEATLSLQRNAGHVYDLVRRRSVESRSIDGGGLEIPVALGPCEGRLLMVTERPVERVAIAAPEQAAPGESIEVRVGVTDGEGDPIDAVVPLEVRISDPEGVAAEGSGHYGAAAGELVLPLDFAPNDKPGLWELRVTEGATGGEATAYVRVKGPESKE